MERWRIITNFGANFALKKMGTDAHIMTGLLFGQFTFLYKLCIFCEKNL